MPIMGQIFSSTKPVTSEPYLYVFDALEKGRVLKLQLYQTEVQGFRSITKNGKGLLHHAVIQGQTKCLQYLISCGLDVNKCDLTQNTPILEIVQSHTRNSTDLEEIIGILLKSGANLNATNAHKRTALLKSIIQFRHNISLLLLKYGADANIADIDGLLPIHVCATYSALPVLKQILASDIDINAQDRKGRTALYFAVLSGDQKIVDELLIHGSDVNLGSLLGYPLQTAIVKCKYEAVKSLLQHGADVHCAITEHRQTLAKSKDYLNLALTILSIELSNFQTAIQKGDNSVENIVSERLKKMLFIVDIVIQAFNGEINIAKNSFFKTKKPQFIESLPDTSLKQRLKYLCNKLNFIHWISSQSVTTAALEGLPKIENSVRYSLENICRMKVRKIMASTSTNIIHVVNQLDCSLVLRDIILLKDV